MARGTLRVYLGAAPGVGKTYAMLSEGRRRHERGTDVVIGFVETHGRPHTAEQIGGLEVVPRRSLTYRGSSFEEMDTAAILARRPAVALVDELAHTNVPGSANTKRFQDIEDLLDAGVDVISTLNIQHLASINDVVEQITGIDQRETVPDEFVRAADQIELVDMTPEALRRRMAHGNIYAAEKIDAALTNYFREGNLGALRELALMWVANQVDDALEDYRERHDINRPWETRERVVVALTGAPGTEDLIRRAARIAQRTRGDLLGVHVVSQHGLVGPDEALMTKHRQLIDEVGGEYHEAYGADPAATLVDFARAENATQLVLGSSRLTRLQTVTRGSIVHRILRHADEIDVHVISHGGRDPSVRLPRLSRRSWSVGPRRLLVAWILTVVGLPAMTLALGAADQRAGLSTAIVVYLLFVVIVAAIGGIGPAIVAAVAGFLAVNWYFAPPLHTLTIADGANLVALIGYLLTALIVSALVAQSVRRRAEAVRARAEATTLSSLATSTVDVDPLPTLLSHLRRSFSLDGATLLRIEDGEWSVTAADGEVVESPSDADYRLDVRPSLVLALSGGTIAEEDRRVLNAFAASLAAALEQRALHARAAEAKTLAEANELRSALLQAVSHDLRTPLAAVKAAVSSLRHTDMTWTETETAEFLATIENETDRLSSLVENLLDMSRLQAASLSLDLREVSLEEVVPGAVAGLGPRARSVVIDVPETLPAVEADAALLERVVANLVDNALTYGNARPVRVEAGTVGDLVLIRVIDQGPGIPPNRREDAFKPFQRFDDATPRHGAGVGLGLAVARGFTRSMHGEITLDDTPGGGTTVIIELGIAR